MSYFFDLTEVTDLEAIKTDWRKLEESADCSFFQSWGWIGTWLQKVVDTTPTEVIRVWDKRVLVAMGILVSVTVRRGGVLVSRKVFLNEAPSEKRNMVIEYNGFLVKRGYEDTVYKDIIYHLRYSNKDWDELYLGMIPQVVCDRFLDQMDEEFYLTLDREVTSWQFNSEGLAPGLEGIYASLSRNRRTQIKRAFRAYEQQGAISISEAETAEQAQQYFDGLKKYHTERWVAQGKKGSFANPVWECFHRALIEQRFENGEIQLLKIATPETTIGYIYNFLWRDRVYVLQTGFNMQAPKYAQPGYVSHIKAIIYNQEKGFNLYDLLSDDSGYKSILCNQTEKLVSVSFKRIAVKSMLRQLSFSNARSGYISKVVRSSVSDKLDVYVPETLDYLREKWIRVANRWPSQEKKYLLVGAESSGTTAVSDLLFRGVSDLRYLEEGEQQWVWDAYRSIYQHKRTLKEYPRLQLFDAIKVPGFSVIINEFLECFPNTTVVYLMRDPRDFANSAIKTWKIPDMEDFHKVPWTNIKWLGIDCDDPVACLAQRWKAYVNAASQVDNIVYIKYEDFCRDKVAVIEALCKQLQLPFDKQRVSDLCDIQLSHASVRAYKPSGPGGWQDSILEDKHIKIIEDICEPEMLKWGYTRSTSG